MTSDTPTPTPFAEVNDAVHLLLAGVQQALGQQLMGAYLIGSLALGAFDRRSSDIDLIIVTEANPNDEQFQALARTHAHLASRSAWASKIEAVYAPREALGSVAPPERYPQIEHGGALFRDALEHGWVFQRWLLRERGITLLGSDPRTLLEPIERAEMTPAVAAIAGMWQHQATHDLSWLEWLRGRDNHRFVVLTLCRMLHSLATGAVVSKPAAAEWAARELRQPWAARALASLAAPEASQEISQAEVEDTLTLLRYTAEQSALHTRSE